MSSNIADGQGVERPDFNRWLIPFAAIAVHICIGSVYAWSVFNKPIKALFPHDPVWFSPPYTTQTAAIVILGLSAAFAGPWVERRGPRVTAITSALFFCSGLLIGGIGLRLGLSWLVFVGMGLVGGIGCGLGYIAPVSTLVKWFPDRRGLATGMAVMGFGGGSLIAGYLNAWLIKHVGLSNTLLSLGLIYLVVMLAGASVLRRPPPGWKPDGWTPAASPVNAQTRVSLTRNQALRRPQFWLLWGILLVNVTAGIGILSQASPMVQDMFGRTEIQAGVTVSLISLFNALGRLFWASLSDRLGRRAVYLIFFGAQTALFVLLPVCGAGGQWLAFQITLFAIFTMYGGGFAVLPAFLADIFGPENVGAIHGAVLTAWSVAAIAGAVIVTQLSQIAKAAKAAGLAGAAARVHAYDSSLHVMAGLLVVGFVLALLIRPLQSPDQQRA